MRGASPATQRPDFLLPTLSRRESHWRLLHNTALNCGQTSSWRRGELLQVARCDYNVRRKRGNCVRRSRRRFCCLGPINLCL